MSIQRRLTAATRSHLIGILYVLAAVIIWSTVPVGTRMLMRGSSAFSAAFISAARLWVAAVVFVLIHAVYCRRQHRTFHIAIERKGWLLIAAASLCINYIFYAVGLRYTTASATSVVSQVNAIATVLLAAWLLGERMTWQKLLGMMLAVAGILLVLFHGTSLRDLLASQYFTGNTIEIIGGLAWPFYAIGQTKLMERTHNRQILMPIFVIAAVFSLLLLPFTRTDHYSHPQPARLAGIALPWFGEHGGGLLALCGRGAAHRNISRRDVQCTHSTLCTADGALDAWRAIACEYHLGPGIGYRGSGVHRLAAQQFAGAPTLACAAIDQLTGKPCYLEPSRDTNSCSAATYRSPATACRSLCPAPDTQRWRLGA